MANTGTISERLAGPLVWCQYKQHNFQTMRKLNENIIQRGTITFAAFKLPVFVHTFVHKFYKWIESGLYVMF